MIKRFLLPFKYIIGFVFLLFGFLLVFPILIIVDFPIYVIIGNKTNYFDYLVVKGFNFLDF